ncbi:MAG: VWA domain-containing protein [Acidobacteria bacterium]|nr:VWA domain-containing protein [Acidobacteriota bacterium]
MMRNTRRSGRTRPLPPALLAAALLLLGAAHAPAQDDNVIRSESNQVFVPVSVSTVEGEPVTDLKRTDFHVLENGIEQELANWAHEEVPLNVVFLMDASHSEFMEMTAIKKAIRAFAAELHAQDRIALVTFNAEARLILNWSNDRERLDKALDRVFPKGNTVWYDALYVVQKDLLPQVQGKKVIVSVTDGWDTGSLVKFQEVLDTCLQSDAQIYIFGKTESIREYAEYFKREYGAKYDETGLMKVMYAAESQIRKLTSETGGRVVDLAKSDKLETLYRKLIKELRMQYYLSYQPYNMEKDGTYREIKVRVDRPGMVIHHRRGYNAK